MSGPERRTGIFPIRERGPLSSLINDFDYIVLPGEPLSLKEQGYLASNTAFVRDIIPSWIKDDEQNNAVVNATSRLMGFVLTSIDREYGHDATTVGKRYLADPYGEESIPMFYHNGSTARLVMRETAGEMERRNREYGERSFFRDRNTFLAGVISSGAADTISDAPRGEEERRTAVLAELLLQMPIWGYDFSQLPVPIQGVSRFLPEVVKDTVIASTYNEETQLLLGGNTPLADVNNDGDFSTLYVREAAEKSFCLAFEVIWKKDTSRLWKQVLLNRARERDFVGNSILDFCRLIEEGHQPGESTELERAIGTFLVLNSQLVNPHTEVDGRPLGHQYKDRRLHELTLGQREDNARLQLKLGFDLREGRITASEAYREARLYSQVL